MFGRIPRLFAQLVVYGAGDVAILAINFLLLPVYTRVLSPTDYGVLALLLVAEAVLKVVYRWGADTAFLRLYYDCGDDRARRTLASTIFFMLFALNGTLLAILIIAAPALAGSFLGTASHADALRLLLLNSFVSGFFFLPFSILRIREQSARFVALAFGRSFSTVLARLLLVVWFRLGVLGIMLADVLVTLALTAVMWRLFHAILARRFSWRVAWETLRYGLPRVPTGLLHQIMAMSDRFFLGVYVPLREVGVYSIGSSIASLLKLYPVAFESAWSPFAFASMRQPDAGRLFARVGTYTWGVMVFLTLAVAGLADGLVRLMTPQAFHEAVRVVPLLALGIALQTIFSFASTSLNIAKRTEVYPVVTTAAAVVSVAGSVWLIPPFGIIGAALAVVAGQLVLAVLTGFAAQRCYRIPYEWARLGKLSLVGAALYAAMGLAGGTGWEGFGRRALLLAGFPAALFALGFFERAELAEVRRVVSTVLASRSRGGARGEVDPPAPADE